MKLSDIILTASSNLRRAKLRSFLTIIAIFIGSLTLTLTNGLGAGISSYIDRQVNSLGAKDVLLVQPKADSISGQSTDAPPKYDPDRTTTSTALRGDQPVLTSADLDKIRSQSGIVSAEPMRSVSATYITRPDHDKFRVSLSQYVDGTNLDMAAGHGVDNHTDQAQILIPLNYVSALGLSSPEQALGRQVTVAVTNAYGQIEAREATITGVLQPSLFTSNEATINMVFLNQLYDLQNVGMPATKVDHFPVVFARFPADYTENQIASLKKQLTEKGYTASTIDDQIGIVKQVIGGIIGVLNFFAAIALLAASFGIINTLLMSVQERTKEIGLMKAMGMSSSRIFFLFSFEAAMLGFWGSLLGVAVAEVGGRLANNLASQTFLKDLVGLQLLSFPWQSVVMIVTLIMLVAFLAGTLPARRAAKQNPIDALRYE